jgi:hypothetical protein
MLLTSWVFTFVQAALKPAGGEKWLLLFSRQTLTGTGFSVAGCREAFHELGVPDVTEFDSD